MSSVLVVEDDPALTASLKRTLSFEGYLVTTAANSEEAWAEVTVRRPDCLIVDVGLPGVSGLELTRRLRRSGDHTPVLMLTARQLTGDRVAGLDAGADDYLTKPFEVEELLARIRALLRRSGLSADPGDPAERVVGDLRMDTLSHEVHRGDREIVLTRTEFLLLEFLMAHPRQVLSRSQLLRHVWGSDFDSGSNTVEVFVSYLRRKTEAGGEPRLIHTVRGAGYIIKEPRP